MIGASRFSFIFLVKVFASLIEITNYLFNYTTNLILFIFIMSKIEVNDHLEFFLYYFFRKISIATIDTGAVSWYLRCTDNF